MDEDGGYRVDVNVCPVMASDNCSNDTKKTSCHGARRKYVGNQPRINARGPSSRTVRNKQSIAPVYDTDDTRVDDDDDAGDEDDNDGDVGCAISRVISRVLITSNGVDTHDATKPDIQLLVT